MQGRVAFAAASAALGVAAGAIPTAASAAEAPWRCAAAPLSGTVLGQSLPAPTVGSTTEECKTARTGAATGLPAVLEVDALNGATAVSQDGAFAGAGLANVSVGSIPVPVGEIPVPSSLTAIEVRLPDTNVLVATVDLTPAIRAITSLPSKNLLDLGVVSSSVTGTCQDGRPVVTGASRVLDADVLGLPVDGANTVDTAVNLLDTSSIALNTLDLSLADVTLVGGTLVTDTSTVLELLKPIVDELPPLAIPPQLARVKLTPATQGTVGGMLVQRALRVEVSLAGQSLADLSLGRAAVGAGDVCAPAAESLQMALECTKRKLTLIDVLPKGDRVRLYGAADKSLAGRTVRIVFQATGATVARTTVAEDGSFTTTAPMPSAKVRRTNRARYIARVGSEKSLNLKLMRRMVVDKVRSRNGKVTIRGRVIAPLATTPQTITLKRRVTCSKLEVVKRFKPASDGRFSVTVRSPENLSATVYRLQTQVRESRRNPRLYPTFTLPRAVDL